jgi:formamidopyrimidine-DNA glycosylase
MPELPEVETMRRGLLPCIGGRVTAVLKPRSRYRPIVMEPPLPALRRRLFGKRIEEVQRLGKRVAIRFDSDDWLILQPKMAGLVLVGLPPNQAHARLVIELEDCEKSPIIYWDQRGLGTVKLWSQTELEDFLESGQLGPDALQASAQEFADRFGISRKEVKPTMLEQHRIAGIGNLYASEILHRCKIDPREPASALNLSDWRRIHHATVAILETAIRYEGSTLSDGSYRNALDRPGSYQNAHRVYDRAGEKCLRCRSGIIQRIVQAQRSTFLCSSCQKLRSVDNS